MKKVTYVLIVILCLTFVGHILFYYFGTASALAQGNKFYDYDSFIAFVEQPGDSETATLETPVPLTVNGKVLLEFVIRNPSVGAVIPANSSDGLPITVCSRAQWKAAIQLRSTILWIFVALYPVELLPIVICARKARREQTN